MDLFDKADDDRAARMAPLPDRMRPRRLDEFVGQSRLLGPGGPLRLLIEGGEIPSMILWGPPGSGKTTLARLIAEGSGSRFEAFSAVLSGVREVRQVVAEASERLRLQGRRTVLFVDEIHRFNKAQQDAFLPHVERGTILLLGATTENPAFEVNGALLSRCRVFTLEPLAPEDLRTLVLRALADVDRGLGRTRVTLEEDALALLVSLADGDARRALTLLEGAVSVWRTSRLPGEPVGAGALRQVIERGPLLYDRRGEVHYDVISAFIKSVRGSDPDAAVYWLARMLDAGEDPIFIARRMVIFASEDVGNADPQAILVAVAATEAVRLVGLPEGRIPLAQAATYLACAPKSNAAYVAINRASEAVRARGALPVPLHLRNAPASLLRDLGYGEGYRDPHDHPGHHVAQQYLPDPIQDERFYEPTEQGREGEIAERLARWRETARKKGAEAPAKQRPRKD